MDTRQLIEDSVVIDTVLVSGRSTTRVEKQRIDGKKQRNYYVAHFKTSLFGKAYSRVMWQDHIEENGEEVCAWRHTPSPETFDSIIGKKADGVSIVFVTLSQPITININERPAEIKDFTVVVLPHENVMDVIEEKLCELIGRTQSEPVESEIK